MPEEAVETLLGELQQIVEQGKYGRFVRDGRSSRVEGIGFAAVDAG